MSVTNVRERWTGRTGSLSLDNYQRDYTRTFHVYTSLVSDDATVVIAGLATVIGDAHPNDAGAIVRNISVNQLEQDGQVWEATVSYSSQTKDPAKNPENPLDKPVVKGMDSTKFQKSLEEDLESEPVVNSAQVPFVNGIAVDDSRATITVEKNYSSATFNELADLFDVINENAWNSFPAETLKVGGVSVKEMFDNDVSYVKIVFTLEYNKDGWQPRVLDQGRHERIFDASAGGYSLSLIKDKYGQALPDPSFLDGNGRLGTEPHYLSFVGYRTNSFASIPW